MLSIKKVITLLISLVANANRKRIFMRPYFNKWLQSKGGSVKKRLLDECRNHYLYIPTHISYVATFYC